MGGVKKDGVEVLIKPSSIGAKLLFDCKEPISSEQKNRCTVFVFDETCVFRRRSSTKRIATQKHLLSHFTGI